jgi:hypothetical protein
MRAESIVHKAEITVRHAISKRLKFIIIASNNEGTGFVLGAGQ